VPVVDLTDIYEIPLLPWVGSDHRAMGVMAADHLRECGVRHFAFCGFRGELWSELRKESFTKYNAELGAATHLWESLWTGRATDYWAKDIKQIAQWIAGLPKPVGIMAANDVRALHVIEACNQLGVVIPDEVAVLGVDDEETLCNLSSPRLSSILPDCREIGFRAAELLDKLMSGGRQRAERILIQPRGVVTRPSTSILAASDPLVVKAIRKMKAGVKRAGGCSISEIAKSLEVSYSTLEKRFVKSLNRSASDVMEWILIARIEKLLLESDSTVEKIAVQSGFKSPEKLNEFFTGKTGLSLEGFRIRNREEKEVFELSKAASQVLTNERPGGTGSNEGLLDLDGGML
jgi:LacI family transcriptional regulator